MGSHSWVLVEPGKRSRGRGVYWVIESSLPRLRRIGGEGSRTIGGKKERSGQVTGLERTTRPLPNRPTEEVDVEGHMTP